MKDFNKIIREKGLPEVGQQVRNKKIWDSMAGHGEKRSVGQHRA